VSSLIAIAALKHSNTSSIEPRQSIIINHSAARWKLKNCAHIVVIHVITGLLVQSCKVTDVANLFQFRIIFDVVQQV